MAGVEADGRVIEEKRMTIRYEKGGGAGMGQGRAFMLETNP